jgi:hypothetical protein
VEVEEVELPVEIEPLDEEPEPTPPTPPAEEEPAPPPITITSSDELPQVITADMLRARRAQRKAIDLDSEEFQIPEELLAGYVDEPVLDEEEELLERARPKGKAADKGKKKGGPAGRGDAKKGGKKPKRWRGDDEFGDF